MTFHERGLPTVICTGQTPENKTGSRYRAPAANSSTPGPSTVYETATGVFAPGHGAQTEQLLYEHPAADWTRAHYANQDPEIRAVLGAAASRLSRPRTSRTPCRRLSTGSTSAATSATPPRSGASG